MVGQLGNPRPIPTLASKPQPLIYQAVWSNAEGGLPAGVPAERWFRHISGYAGFCVPPVANAEKSTRRSLTTGEWRHAKEIWKVPFEQERILVLAGQCLAHARVRTTTAQIVQANSAMLNVCDKLALLSGELRCRNRMNHVL